jgi:hypothetical protein
MTKTVEYEVVRELGPVEIRRYPTIVLVTVIDDNDNSAFSMLFQYISGNNEPNERIAMTAPVISGEGSFSFILPSNYDIEAAPRPTDPNIKIVEIPPRHVAAVKFRGHAHGHDVNVEKRLLLDALAGYNIKIKGEPFLMRYNSPLTPGFLRHNEMGVEIINGDKV